MERISNFFTPGTTFLLTLAFGFWLSRGGRPYNGLLFNIHKLIALAAVVLTTITVYKLTQAMNPPPLIFLWFGLAALSVIALFASGAIMSIGTTKHALMKTIHNIAPFVAVATLGMIIFSLG